MSGTNIQKIYRNSVTNTQNLRPAEISVIAEYKNDEWYNVGNLKQSRYAHGAITSGPLTMVIGGNFQGGGS